MNTQQVIQIYDIPEVCEILKVGRNTVYNLINEGKLATFKLHGRRKVRAKAISDMIQKAEADIKSERHIHEERKEAARAVLGGAA